MRRAFVVAGLFVAATLHANTASDRLAEYSASLSEKFPDVPTITTAELAALAPPPVLLDARSAKEFAVSHIPNSLRFTGTPDLARDQPIAVYCSVGYRSALVVRKLQAAGFTNVRNLEGSIFAWANEGRPLVHAIGPATGVHPFNFLWGRYLDRRLWKWNLDEDQNRE